MLILVQIDLSGADIALFESYEARALALLSKYGGRLEERVRAVSSTAEMQLLYFPDERALSAFRLDPSRAALREDWVRCGASSQLSEVVRIG
ncbi:hypothetical protein ACE103_11085 [Bradyrhizobium sp. ma5]|uniref:hypothetical protein n=1 Tax=Bradyrhizobium sp. ma5 TaxID=3344828 RepID=UPI0035D4742E